MATFTMTDQKTNNFATYMEKQFSLFDSTSCVDEIVQESLDQNSNAIYEKINIFLSQWSLEYTT